MGRFALRSTRAARLVTATTPRMVAHAVPIPFVLAREAGAWTVGTRCPTLVPWLGVNAQLEATKKVAMITGDKIQQAASPKKKMIKIGKMGEKTAAVLSTQDLTSIEYDYIYDPSAKH